MALHISRNILPDGPRKSKILQMFEFGKDAIGMLRKCSRIYGKRFTLRLFGQPPYLIISSPDDIKAVFMDHSDTLDTGMVTGTVLKPIFGDNSIFILNEEKHLFHRKLMLPPFHGEQIKSYGKTMQDITMERVAKWQIGDEMSIFSEALIITFDIILNKIFGFENNHPNYNRLASSLEELMLMIGKPLGIMSLLFKSLQINLGGFSPWAKIQRLKKEVDDILLQEIELRMKADCSSKTDILSLLIQAKDENGTAMSKDEIKDEMISLLVAGHQTTATSITWAMYYILANKDILDKLLEELSSTGVEDTEIYTVINKLPYMDMVVNETLRIAPVVPIFGRFTTKDFQLNDMTVPAGVIIYIAAYLTHHDELNWQNPDKFIPERFAKDVKFDPYAFIPFGNGIRRCIGASFATYETKIILASILLNAKLKLANSSAPKAVRRSVIMIPSDLVPVVVTEKS